MRTMSPFLKVMQLFLMMTGTVLGMLLLLLVTPDIEDTMLRAVARYQRRQYSAPEVVIQNNFRIEDEAVASSMLKVDTKTKQEVRAGRSIRVEVDRGRKSYTPWGNSEDCNRYKVQFARQHTLARTALVSFPGSGNTWLRYLIEMASGIFTGSVYTDRQIISKGFYGEAVPPDCGCTAVQKTHGFALAGVIPPGTRQKEAEVKQFKGRAILLLRNPYEALLSYRNFLFGGHTGFAPHDSFKGHDWEQFVSHLALVWRELAATWINCTNGNESMVVHFEQLRVDPRPDLDHLMRFLGLPLERRRLACVLRHVDGPFKRLPSSQQQMLFSTRDPFNTKLHRLLDTAILDIDGMLERRGWTRIPTHLYKFYEQKRYRNNVDKRN